MPTLVVLLEQLLSPVPGGTGRYSRELAAALAATAPPGWTVHGVVARHPDVSAARIPGVQGPTTLSLPRRALIAAWDAGVPLWPGGADVAAVHAPTPLAPPSARAGTRLVVTVHDTVPYTHPHTLTRRGERWHRRQIARAATRADALVVPTAAVAADLARRVELTVPVRVVGEGPTAAVTTAPERSRAAVVAARLGLPRRYVLAVGTLEPRKGLDLLLAALARPEHDTALVLVGATGWGGVDPRTAATEVGLPAERLRVLGHIPDADLAVALHGASVLAAPSRAEGFGLPVLEAMAAGVPVVHSDDPALVEVAGGAGIGVPREDVDALAAALRTVLTDPDTAERMRVAGRARAAQFSWEQTARTVWPLHLPE